MDSLTPALILRSLEDVGTTLVGVVFFALLLQFLVYVVLHRVFKTPNALAFTLLVPGIVGLTFLVIIPVLYNFGLAFTNMSLRRFGFDRGMTIGLAEGIENFVRVFTRPIMQRATFFPVLGRTMLWTAIQVTFHVGIGLFVAILLNRKMKLRAFYRTIILVPWAIPQIISVLTWRTEFNVQYGFVNILLRSIDLPAIPWLTSNFWNFVAFNIVNIWLGVPFMAVILLGALQSIDHTYYDTAEIDGASWRQRFSNVTIPLIKPVMTPAVILGVIWTFNNFNIPYFINVRSLETSDILVTALFRAAFEYNRYGFAAALAVIIFLILFMFTVFYIKVTRFDPSIGGAKPKAVKAKRGIH